MREFLKKMFGDESTKILKRLQPKIEQMNELESTMQELSDEKLQEKTDEFRQRITQDERTEKEILDELLPEAFAVVREAARRTLGMRHYDVQLLGGIALHEGSIAEMKTGEGKTLVAVLPLYLNALSGKGAHLVTVNDYLARRDADWMGQVYHFLGLSVGVVNSDASYLYSEESGDQEKAIDANRDELGSFKVFEKYLASCERKEAYRADVTYGTNNQFGFDYLRDNTQTSIEGIAQRTDYPHNFAIVDEVDSILIDEARVPLILSTQSTEGQELYPKFANIALQMSEGTDYEVDEKMKAVTLTEAGMEKAERSLGVSNLYTNEGVNLVHHLEAALKAKSLYLKDRDYLVKNNQVLIVDPFTGRTQEGRRWSEGLHQAIEAKEGLTIGAETKTVASITYQNYFKFYSKLSGMTGTAKSSSEEFNKVYDLEVIEVPTNKPVVREDLSDLIFQTEKGKLKAIAQKVKELYDKGQPVLLGTIAVEKNELLSAYLTEAGVPHQLLNAKNHEKEGEIIAQAGQRGAVTVATNMAGRGVDIKLGGNPATQEQEDEVRNLGGLFVLGTERHDARRIDNQLRGRSGRQGDPGASQFFVSLEDHLMRVFGSERMQAMIGSLGLAEDQPIQNKFISNGIEKAQQKIEGFNFDARKNVLAFDDVLSKQRETVYERRNKILFNDEEFVASLYEEILNYNPEAKEGIESVRNNLGDEEQFFAIFRQVSLSITDKLWMEHLHVMDNTRQSVNLRAYGQKDPVVEYKKEGVRLFREMEDAFRNQVSTILSHMDPEELKRQGAGQEENDLASEATSHEYGRNEKVIIEKDGEQKSVKYKKLDPYLQAGWKLKS